MAFSRFPLAKFTARTALALLLWNFGEASLLARDASFLERFAVAEDRSSLLAELIPGTEDYFFYHCLHYQTTNQIESSRKILDQWATQVGVNENVQRAQLRQFLLEHSKNPEGTIAYLKNQLGLRLDHAAPQKDEAASLPTQLSMEGLDWTSRLKIELSQPGRLQSVDEFVLEAALPLIRKNKDDLRVWLQRIRNVDTAGLIDAIEQELKLPDSKGFGWAPIHQSLTLSQYDELLNRVPNLIQSPAFVMAKIRRLRPAEGMLIDDPQTQKANLDQLYQFAVTLPASQNSLKANILFSKLTLDEQQGTYNKDLLLQYLKLPLQRPISVPNFQEKYRGQVLVNPNLDLQADLRLPPIGDDRALLERYLTHFLQKEENADAFGEFFHADYLRDLFAVSKILAGVGDSKRFYTMLSPEKQKEVQSRIEVKFAPSNRTRYGAKEQVAVRMQLKNTPELLIKIYKLNARNILSNLSDSLDIGIDVDGLVPNVERSVVYALPSERRHEENIDLPELNGAGVWIVDFLASGVRSRTLIQKGGLHALHSLSDAGNIVRIVDDEGKHVPSGRVWFGEREYSPETDGNIVIPFGSETRTEKLLLLDGGIAAKELFIHHGENHQLQAKFLTDPQQWIEGTEAFITFRPRLLCNNIPASLELLSDVRLTVKSTDLDGTTIVRSFPIAKLDYDREIVQRVAVLPRLTKVEIELTAKIRRITNNQETVLSARHEFSLNQTVPSNLARDIFLRHGADGYQIEVRGRNGEPIRRLPLLVELKWNGLASTHGTRLATDDNGVVRLGALPQIDQIMVQGAEAHSRTFVLTSYSADWPSRLNLSSRNSIQLPLSEWEQDMPASMLGLHELRGGNITASFAKKIRRVPGGIEIVELPLGLYRLVNYHNGRQCEIRVVESDEESNLLSTNSWVGDASPSKHVLIQSAERKDGKVRIQLGNSSKATRVHILAKSFDQDQSWRDSLGGWSLPLFESQFASARSQFVDSLKLDEEYQYVLNRRTSKKYPGSMLQQPSVLLNPWQLATTQNASQTAAAGDPMPKSAPNMPAPGAAKAQNEMASGLVASGVHSFDFLKHPAIVAANLRPDENGQIVLDAKMFDEYALLDVIAVDDTTTANRQIQTPLRDLKTIDRRLAKSLDGTKAFVQREVVSVLPAGVHTIGDSSSTRLKVMSSLRDVFNLYRSLQGNSDSILRLEPLLRWNSFSEEDKKKQYALLACHEAHLFLSIHDRPFFEKMVRPYLLNKMQKQFMDDYLLENDLTSYLQPWRMTQLNAAERVLLATRIEKAAPRTLRAMQDWMQSHPTREEIRKQAFSTSLGWEVDFIAPSDNSNYYFRSLSEAEDVSEEKLGKMLELSLERGAVDAPADKDGVDRFSRSDAQRFGRMMRRGTTGKPGKPAEELFENIEATRKWAETNYLQVPIASQSAELVPISEFWIDYLLAKDKNAFLSTHLEGAASNATSAWLALSLLRLPLEATSPETKVEKDQLVVETQGPTIAFVQAIRAASKKDESASVLLSQQVYLASETNEAAQPIVNRPLVKGVVYRLRTVVTNPNAAAWKGQILQQIPTGSIPVGNTKRVMVQNLELQAFTTQEVNSLFYMPEGGDFQLTGATLSAGDSFLAKAENLAGKVQDKPDPVDENSWYYVAAWGTLDQVVEYLKSANVHKISLDSIAWRMSDPQAFDRVLTQLDSMGVYSQDLWGYAWMHKRTDRIREYIEATPSIVSALMPSFENDLAAVSSTVRYQYEHLDFRPLILARIHPLGNKPQLLNDGLIVQYDSFLKKISYQPELDDSDRLAYVYYLLLQNRIEDSLKHFSKIKPERLATKLQYDYFDAYLAFSTSDYDRAVKIAGKYQDYPHPRWSILFQTVREHVLERRALETGLAVASNASNAETTDRDQRILMGDRDRANAEKANSQPSLDFVVEGNEARVSFRNIPKISVRYYLMDIELMFSRNPFVAKEGRQLATIEANHQETIETENKPEVQSRLIELPAKMKNRNVLIEVSSDGIIRTEMIYANALRANFATGAGRVQVLSKDGNKPLEATYIKVYSRNNDGSVTFYKDGYTDLRGQFDYASLSTNDLDKTQRFSILVLHPELGALVQEVAPPKR